MLKTIEGFAVECSINKVWTSEALAWAVDEAMQVFGGNGYSREFPVERMYRDARITRIYEGTNEINRMLIPARLLKQSPRRCSPPTRRDAVADRLEPSRTVAAERDVVARRKRLAIALLGQAAATYGDALQGRAGSAGADRRRRHRGLRDRERRCRARKSCAARRQPRRAGAPMSRVSTPSDAADRIARGVEAGGRRAGAARRRGRRAARHCVAAWRASRSRRRYRSRIAARRRDLPSAVDRWLNGIRSERAMSAAARADHVAPGAVFALIVLFAINLMNFFDRQIIGGVGEGIRREWALSDTALGLLGTVFTLLYARRRPAARPAVGHGTSAARFCAGGVFCLEPADRARRVWRAASRS